MSEVWEERGWNVKAEVDPEALQKAALRLAQELLEMDEIGAIELATWPNARLLIVEVLE